MSMLTTEDGPKLTSHAGFPLDGTRQTVKSVAGDRLHLKVSHYNSKQHKRMRTNVA